MKTATQLENLKKLQEFWKTVPAEEVALDEWDCGTHACLGGWAVRSGLAGPEAAGNWFNYSRECYGSPMLFSAASHPSDWEFADDRGCYTISDYERAAARIQWELDNP